MLVKIKAPEYLLALSPSVQVLAFHGSICCFCVFIQPAASWDQSMEASRGAPVVQINISSRSKGALSMLLFTNITPHESDLCNLVISWWKEKEKKSHPEEHY